MNRANLTFNIENSIADGDGKIAGRVYEKMIDISAAEILLLNSAPKELVAAPGPGKVIEFMSAVFFLDYGTEDYDNTANLSIQTITGNVRQSDSLAAAACLELDADGYGMFQAIHTETAINVNDGLELIASAVPGAGGGGTLKINVMYRIHDFN